MTIARPPAALTEGTEKVICGYWLIAWQLKLRLGLAKSACTDFAKPA